MYDLNSLPESAWNETTRRELKVRLPVRLHIQLHATKLLGGDTISHTVTVALEQYFERKRATIHADRTAGPGMSGVA